jgi:hypothetical protein
MRPKKTNATIHVPIANPSASGVVSMLLRANNASSIVFLHVGLNSIVGLPQRSYLYFCFVIYALLMYLLKKGNPIRVS